ncbi:MAG: hypothetical protein H0X24_16655 [Ktedonobacterales bacterium]|nr:hypothetical protein [Ktedonobacterales bacterium]
MRGTALQRFETIYPLPVQASAAHAPSEPARAAERLPAGPYALRHPQAVARQAAQAHLTRGWVWGHVGLSLLAIFIGVTLIFAAPDQHVLGAACLSLAIAGIASTLLALGALTAGHVAGAAGWLLLYDFVATSVGMLVLGPQFAIFFLLPGAVLLTALLTNRWTGTFGLAGAFALYALGVALTQTETIHPLATPSATQSVWLNLGFILLGTGLLAYAAHWLLAQLHTALTNEAALTFRLQALERRARTKRLSLDADAMALQAQIAQAMSNHRPQSIVTGEELAPLAQMINAANARIPSLLHDRDERLKLERAVRDLIQALEAAWAGFTLTWPAPSHTIVDRLLPLLRPHSTQTTSTIETTH